MMNDFARSVSILEFDKILGLLEKCSPSEAAAERIRKIIPSTDPDEIRLLQKETSAAKKLIAQKGAPYLGCNPAIPDTVERASKGAVLNMAELLRVSSLLSAVSSATDYAKMLGVEYAPVKVIFSRLIRNKTLEDKIKHCIISEETVADDASPALFAIRKKAARSAEKIREILQHYVSGAYSMYLQENIITFRNSRFVIPVKSEYKNEIKGLVHDTSSSGATVFIEPVSVVELNNEIKILEGEEKKEIERILRALSDEVAAFSDELILDYHNITELALIFARAELSYRMDACEPAFSSDGEMELVLARHPLLDKRTAVPITLSIGKKYDTLVITGPNTGGKTVTLKTCGLLSMMAQSGLHIPAESAKFPVFTDVLADIGDEQSIEMSLSTFSSHMVNIISMLKRAKKGALILFDELGSGTDPVEGAALAESIIESVREKGAICIATTHYPELKTYALETEGVENASCEFDITTLRPTYRLIMGTPGKSNAFLISERLGMPKEVISRAEILIKAENRRFEKVVAKLEEERIAMEKELEAAKIMRAEAESMRDSALSEREAVLAAAEKELERAKKEAQRLVFSARDVSERAFAEVEKMRRAAEKEKNLEMLEKARGNLKRELSLIENDIISQVVDSAENNDNYVLPRPLRVGDEVLVTTVDREGVVESIGKDITVRISNSRMKADAASLRLITGLKKKKEAKGQSSASPRNLISASIDVRGMVTDDAWFVVDKYLDDAVIAGLSPVTVIHGKGTGMLKKGLWQYFKGDKRIKKFRLGLYGEGDGGVTVIDLK